MTKVVHQTYRVTVVTTEGLTSIREFEGTNAGQRAMEFHGTAVSTPLNMLVLMFSKLTVFGGLHQTSPGAWQVVEADDIYGRCQPGFMSAERA